MVPGVFLQIAPEQVISHTFLVPVVPTTLPWITNSSDNSFHSWSVLVFIVFSYPSFWAALKRKDLSRFSEAWSKALTSGLLLTACSGRLFCVLCFRRDWFRTTTMVMVLWCLISLQDVCMLGNLISCGNEWRGAILNSVGTPIFLYYFEMAFILADSSAFSLICSFEVWQHVRGLIFPQKNIHIKGIWLISSFANLHISLWSHSLA